MLLTSFIFLYLSYFLLIFVKKNSCVLRHTVLLCAVLLFLLIALLKFGILYLQQSFLVIMCILLNVV